MYILSVRLELDVSVTIGFRYPISIDYRSSWPSIHHESPVGWIPGVEVALACGGVGVGRKL